MLRRVNKEFLIDNSSFQDLEYVNIQGPYSQMVMNQGEMSSVEHFISGHNIIVPVNMNFIIGKDYSIEGYYNNGRIYVVVIDGKRLLESVASIHQLKRSRDQDKEGCTKLGWATVIIAIVAYGLIYGVSNHFNLSEKNLISIIFLSLALASILIVEIFVYTHGKKTLYEVSGIVENVNQNIITISGVNIKGLNPLMITTNQYIKVEGIKDKSNGFLIAKKLNGNRLVRPKLGMMIIFMLTVCMILFSYNLYSIYKNPEYVAYKEYKRSLDKQSKTVFSTCAEINNTTLLVGQRIILKDACIYTGLDKKIYLIDEMIPLSKKETRELDRVYEAGLSALESINSGTINDSLYLEKENRELLRLKRNIEKKLKKTVALEIVGTHQNYDDTYMTIQKDENYYYLASKDRIKETLTGHPLKQLSGYIEEINYNQGTKYIKINGYFNSHQSKLEAYAYMNKLSLLYITMIFLIATISLIKIILYKNQLKHCH